MDAGTHVTDPTRTVNDWTRRRKRRKRRRRMRRTTTTTKKKQKREERKELVSWCFKPSQLQGITSGPKETFIKRYVVERTSKAKKTGRTE